MNRLKELRKELNLFQSDVANQLGIATPAYANYEAERRDMSTEIQKRIADYFKVSVDYLMGYTNERNADVTYRNIKLIRILGDVPAGEPNGQEEIYEGTLAVDSSLLKIHDTSEYFALRVKGESMNKIMAPGSVILIHKQECAENNDIVVVRFCDTNEVTVKRYKYTDDEHFIILQPESTDPYYVSKVIDLQTDQIEIIGKVISITQIL